MEAAFDRLEKNGGERLGAFDFLQAAVAAGDEELRLCLAEAGLTKGALSKAADQQKTTRDVLPPEGIPAGTKVLARFGRDLTAAALDGKLMPVIGRDAEVEQIQRILLRLTKNNPVIVGDPGTGKTAIVEGLAQRIAAAGNAPESLKRCRIVSLDLDVTGSRSEIQGRIRRAPATTWSPRFRPVRARSSCFLDEIHTLVGAGGNEGGMDAANILKPPLARGELRCIGATTHDEYRERIEKDGALERRFQPVIVKEPSDEKI